MALSDRKEPVNVTLCIEDWAVVILALSASDASLESKDRMISTIFESARTTERILT